MGSCLNSLEDPVVFVSIAALLALVLLVWVQLHVHGKGPRSVHWVCGVAWAYLALLFALTAVALFVHDNTSACAKGFLILAFFMTGINIFILFLLNIAELFIRDFSGKKPLKKPYEEPPVQSLVGESAKNKCWAFVWLALLVGLALVSFSVANKLTGLWSCWFWYGVVLVKVTILFVIWMILKNFWHRLCTKLRGEWREVWGKRKKCWQKLSIAIFITVVSAGFISFCIACILKWCCFWIIGGVLFLVVICCIFVKICKSDPKNDC